MGTLYDELGVRPDASADELRHAYRRRARQLHPDLRPGDQDRAAEAMSRLNSAWGVLSDPDRRRRYDLELALARAQQRAATRVAEGRVDEPRPPHFDGDDGDRVGIHPGAGFRPRLWMLMVGVLAVIFVFTAYAAGRPVAQPEPPAVDTCLGMNETYVPCTQPHIGKLVSEIDINQPCPRGSLRHNLPGSNRVACLVQG